MDAILTRLQECVDGKAYKTTMLTLLSIAMVPSCVGNTLIIMSYVKFRHFHKAPVHKLIFNVAISDLLVGIVMLLYPIEALIPVLSHNKLFCISRMTAVSLSLGSSTVFLTFVSVDRYFAVVHPLQHMVHSRRKKSILTLILVAWIFLCAVGVVMFYNRFNGQANVNKHDTNTVCTHVALGTDQSNIYVVVFLGLTSIIDFTLYTLVIRTLVTRNQLYATATKKKQIRKTKLLMFSYVVFFICWLPYLVLTIVLLIGTLTTQQVCVRKYANILGYLNSAMNWMFYGVGNKLYRDAFKALLCSCRDIRCNGTSVNGQTEQIEQIEVNERM